jgi:UDP-N-acetylmuramate dehydrogenase
MQVYKDPDLRAYNSFGLSARCKYLIDVHEADEIPKAIEMAGHFGYPFMILGGGSNVLFTNDYQGSIIRICIAGIEANEDGDEVVLTAGAGVVWHELVQYAVAHNYGGIENLALIPGTVGASPIQNIGAYGVELQDVFESLAGYHLEQGFMRFNKNGCKFGYRQSIFKGELKGKFVVSQVSLRLHKHHELNLKYGAIQDELSRRKINTPTIADVADVVSNIRQSKLPDPTTIGNAGSFFKNPELPEASFKRLQIDFPDLPGFPAAQTNYTKTSAAYMIEQCGWKGKVMGETGTYDKHALVLVNHGKATGSEIWSLAQEIQKSVYEKFGVKLEPEVNIIGS